jgi:adenosyl cobinamide kinase/adenosyl cobinamide phosphate guanylyltransferase
LGEGSVLSGGLLRFDREKETTQRFDFPDVAKSMRQVSNEILIASNFGIGIVKGGRVSRYFVDLMSDGHYRVVEAITPK